MHAFAVAVGGDAGDHRRSPGAAAISSGTREASTTSTSASQRRDRPWPPAVEREEPGGRQAPEVAHEPGHPACSTPSSPRARVLRPWAHRRGRSSMGRKTSDTTRSGGVARTASERRTDVSEQDLAGRRRWPSAGGRRAGEPAGRALAQLRRPVGRRAHPLHPRQADHGERLERPVPHARPGEPGTVTGSYDVALGPDAAAGASSIPRPSRPVFVPLGARRQPARLDGLPVQWSAGTLPMKPVTSCERAGLAAAGRRRLSAPGAPRETGTTRQAA